MIKKTFKLAILATILPIFIIGISNAQVIEREGIEEIIVTAQKTEQNIQDVPIAVTAFDTGSLELQQIETLVIFNSMHQILHLQKVTSLDQILLSVVLTLILLQLQVIVVLHSI